jgi:hypothetical protein
LFELVVGHSFSRIVGSIHAVPGYSIPDVSDTFLITNASGFQLPTELVSRNLPFRHDRKCGRLVHGAVVGGAYPTASTRTLHCSSSRMLWRHSAEWLR